MAASWSSCRTRTTSARPTTTSALNLFVHDLATATTVYVAPVTPTESGSLHPPSISSDGRRVGFVSEISGLTGERDAPGPDAFVFDLPGRSLQLVSRASGRSGQPGEAWSTNAQISADGKVVAFASPSLNLAPGVRGVVQLLGVSTFVRDLSTQRTSELVDGGYLDEAGAVADLALSGDGRFVTVAAYSELGAAPGTAAVQLFVHDRKSRSTIAASRASGAAGRLVGYAFMAPSIATDGRLVSFQSDAAVIGARPGAPQLFVRDLATGDTFPVSRQSGAGGRLANEGVTSTALSPEGRFAAFSTRDASLDPEAPSASLLGAAGYARELGPLPPDAVSPSVGRLRLSRRRVRVPARPGRTALVTVSYELSELAKVRMSLQRRTRSIARGRRRPRCVARRRRNPPRLRRRASCAGYRTVATFHDQQAWGPRRLVLQIRRTWQGPRPGRYRVLLVATDTAGNRSVPRAARVVLVRR